MKVRNCYTFAIGALVLCGMLAAAWMATSAVVADDEAPAAGQTQDIPSSRGQRTTTRQTDAIHLAGKGREASERFMLEPGLAVLEVAHEGRSNFIVRLLDHNGKEVDTLFNQIGEFNGQRGFEIREGGRYLLDVVANGPWSVTIHQPRPDHAAAALRSIRGTGYTATEFFELQPGLNVFKLNYTGKDRFRVTLTDRDGRLVESLINVIGPFAGSKPVSIQTGGTYFLNVSASGDWTVEIEQ